MVLERITKTTDYIDQYGTKLEFPSGSSWVILNPIEKRIKEKIEQVGIPLKDWDISINYGIKTGCNEAFIIDKAKRDELIAKDKKSAEIIRPILRGRDIKRYGYEFAELYLLYIPWHFPLHLDTTITGASQEAEKAFLEEYPAVYNNIYGILGEYKKALEFHNKAILIYKKIYDKDHIETAITYSYIGKIYTILGKSLGISVLYDALKIFQKYYGENHFYTAGAYIDIGLNHIENDTFIMLHDIEDSIYKLSGDKNINKGAEYALTSFSKALVIYKNLYGENHFYTALAYNYLGKAQILAQYYDKANNNLEAALNIINEIPGDKKLHSSIVYVNLGLLYKYKDEYDKALYYYEKVIQVKKTYFNDDNIAIASTYNEIADVYLRFNKNEEAIEYYLKDVEILKKYYDDDKNNLRYEKMQYRSNKNTAIIMKLMVKNKILLILYMLLFVFTWIIKNIHKFLLAILKLPIGLIIGIPKLIKFLIFMKKLKKSPKNEEALDGLGDKVYSFFNKNDNKSIAIKMHERIIKKYLNIAEQYYTIKKYEEALKYFLIVKEFKKRIGTDVMLEDDNIILNLKIGIPTLLL